MPVTAPLRTALLVASVAGATLAAACSRAGVAHAGTPSAAPGVAADTAARPDSGFAVERLAEGVYAVIRREPPAVINESNSLVVVGDDDVLVVDAQSSLERTRQTLAAVRAITTRPVRTLVLTHWHDDHVFGAGVYRDAFPDVRIVAHEASAEDLATLGARARGEFERGRAGTRGFLLGLVTQGRSFAGGPLGDEERRSHLSAARLVEDYGRAPDGYAPPVPTTLVRDRLSLRQGARTIDVLYLGRGHSRGDLVVHLPAEGIVAAGDLVMWPVQFVGTTSYPPDFAVAVDRLRALRPSVVVPGHGPVLRGDTADRHVALIARLLHTVTDRTREAVARGDSLAAARRAVDLAELRAAMAGESAVRRILFDYYVTTPAVQRAFELLGGAGAATADAPATSDAPATADAQPAAALASLLAADRAFAAAARDTTLPDALGRMFDDGVLMLAGPELARGRAAAVAALRRSARQATARATWTPIRGGVSSDGTQGFTYGYLDVTAADGAALPGKYVSYWRRTPAGWRVVAYKRTPRAAGPVSLAERAPSLPEPGLPRGAAGMEALVAELMAVERAFSDLAQERGLGPAFAANGAPDAANSGGPADAEFRFGPAAIAEGVSAGVPPGVTLTWGADHVIAAPSGDLAVNLGMITVRQPAAAGGTAEERRVPFLTVWRRTPAGWRYVIE